MNKKPVGKKSKENERKIFQKDRPYYRIDLTPKEIQYIYDLLIKETTEHNLIEYFNDLV